MAAPATDEERAARDERFSLPQGSTLRQHAARGTIINGVFNVSLTALTFLKGFILAAFLSPRDYGIWGILLIGLGTLAWLKQVGVGDKYVQQDEEDQELAFHRAFTMELIVNGALFVLLLAAVPIMALIYGRSELLAPGFAMCMIVPAGVLQVPFWVLYRRLEFKRQRLYQAIDPVVAFVVTIVLAITGAGYWSLILGVLAGSWTGALVALSISPYKLRLRTDRLTRASYISFSLPLFVASVGGIVIAQGSIFFGEAALGLVGAGAITLSAQITQLAQRVDEVVTSTLYPVICAVADKRDVLFETFTKSNRIALMWAMPFGIGLALFGADLVHDVLGHKWEPAIGILQATGVAAGLSQLGFNWTSYVRALGDTRPIAVNTVTQAVVFLATVPLFYIWGRAGYAASVLIVLGASLVVRSIYLRRIFQGFAVMSHAVRALLPSVPAVAAVLLVRLATGGGTRSTAEALAELLLYAAVTVAATLAFERALLAEALGYLRRRYGGAPAPA